MCDLSLISYFFFFNDTATTEIYTLSLHDALPIYSGPVPRRRVRRRHHVRRGARPGRKAGLLHRLAPDVAHAGRSEEHTSELQSPCNLVCRLLLEKKKKKTIIIEQHTTERK